MKVGQIPGYLCARDNPITAVDPSGQFALGFTLLGRYTSVSFRAVEGNDGHTALIAGLGPGNPGFTTSIGVRSGDDATASCSDEPFSIDASTSGGATVGSSYSTDECDATFDANFELA